MSEWMPEIVKIEEVQKHPDADTLDVVTVNGDYHVITKLNEYKVGDLVAYIPIDTIFPDTEEFYYLTPNKINCVTQEDGSKLNVVDGKKSPLGFVPKKHRIISAKKIRGIYSTGLIMPKPEGFNEHDSIVDHFKLEKLDDEDQEIYGDQTKINNRFTKNQGPDWVQHPKHFELPYYDIESARKLYQKVCVDFEDEVVILEKIHGSNGAYVHDGKDFYAKSRNCFKSDRSINIWHQVAQRFEISEKIKSYPMMAFFGEIYGHQKNKAGRFAYDTVAENGGVQLRFRVFDIYDIENKKYLDHDEVVAIVNACGLDLVPELYRGKMPSKEELYAMAEGFSTLNPKTIREGIVIKTTKEKYSLKLGGRFQLKLVGEGYTLKK